MPGENIDESQEGVDEIVDKAIANYELLQEENKLLIQEKEYYYDQRIKKMSGELDNLRK